MKQYFLIFGMLILAALSCKKGFEGTKSPLLPPETFMAVDTIFRTGDARLTTLVEAHWWGNSKGGLVVAYDVSIDSMHTWTRTKIQDSSFLLKIPTGKDSADLAVYVRAVDNLGQVDPTPASTLFPIKNSSPKAQFVFSQPIAGIPSQNPTVVFPVIKYSISGSDPDGLDDIKNFEIYINDTNGPAYSLPPSTSSFTVVAQSPSADSSLCTVFLGTSTKSQPSPIGYLRTNATNIFYIRAVDKADAKSKYAATPAIWVKKKASDILLVNAYNSSKLFVQNFYTQNLKNIGIAKFDTLQATEVVNINYTQLQPDYLTQSRTFALFNKMVWFGDDATFSLSLGQRSTSDFFNNGGRLFMALAINSNFDPLSNFLDWTPIKNLVAPPLGAIFRVNINANVTPNYPTWPTIQSTAIIASVRPFEIGINTNNVGYDSLYSGGIIVSYSGQSPAPWTGLSTVLAKRYTKPGNQTNFVISSLPIDKFNGLNNMDSVFRNIFITELGFQ